MRIGQKVWRILTKFVKLQSPEIIKLKQYLN